MSAKYIFVNGVLKLNPQYTEQSSTIARPKEALAIVSSVQDIVKASEASGQELKLASSTISAMTTMSEPSYLKKFETTEPLDGGNLLDGLYGLFEKYEVPMGLVNKLLALTEYDQLDFIIDDSGSMGNDTDAKLNQATDYIKNKPAHGHKKNADRKMTRWEEVEDRLHILMDILSYLPIKNIRIHFLNRRDELQFSHAGKTQEQFAQTAHEKISAAFTHMPAGGTPLYGKLTQAFNQSGKILHYLFTDGVPSDADAPTVGNLVQYRKNPENHPLTFMSCTDNETESQWMKEIEEAGPYTSELDDFESERKEVLHDQGVGLPFSRGFWLLCQLTAAINPDDLDALDESIPFSRFTLSNLLGREMSPQEYYCYFNNHPQAQQYSSLYPRLLDDQAVAKTILSQPVVPVPLSYAQFPIMFGQTVPPPPPPPAVSQEYGLPGYSR